MGKKMETRGKGQRGSGGFDPKIKDLQCFLNQPNINMVLPWLYDIYKNIVKPDSSKKKRGEEDPVLKDLQCFLNQPNINMAIPWIYEIRKAVKEGGGGGGGSGYEWEDETRRNNDDIAFEEG